MTIQVARLFHPRRTAFWATTYSFELELFDQFLLGRLGDPPLNAVLLIDQGKATELWTGLSAEEAWRARRANSDYLVRGVRSEGGGAFHPKTYLLADHEGGTLLVGSGNLTLNGLERGNETFAEFDSSDDDGLSAIRAWHGWVAGIVEQLADEQLSRRLTALRLGCPWLVGADASSLFVTNAELSLLDQFVERLAPPVAELHVCAPFYDHDLAALSGLMSRIQPRRLHLYFGAETSVAGDALAELVDAQGSSAVVLRRFDPERFVHAKLVAAIDGDQGVVLSGSANLSRPALLLDAAAGGANVEAGVMATLRADLIRERCVPPGTDLVELELDEIRDFKFASSPEPAPPALSVISATPLPDGRIRVHLRGERSGTQLTLAWYGGSSPLDADATSRDAIEREAAPLLVWLTDESGERVSNRVPLDDPGALEHSLHARREATDRPTELDPGDAETPVGRILLVLHETCIFDIDESPAATDARRAIEDSLEQTDPGFWDRLTREALGVDHRADSYKRLRDRAALLEDDLFSLLSIMLDRAPGERRLRLLAGAVSDEEDEPGPGTKWSAEARLRVRVTNVLRRWSRALADPRLRWLSELAPVRNYIALLMATGALWQERVLDRLRAAAVLEDLFGSFVRRERTPGYLATLDDDERGEALRVVPDEAGELAAALLYCSLSPEAPWPKYIFDWQPFLTAGLEWGLFMPGRRTLDAVEWVIDRHPSLEEVEERLLWAAEYINDERWGAQTAAGLGLEGVELAHRGYHAEYPVRLAIKGVERPLTDPRILVCARQALAYRDADGITVVAGDVRLSLKLGRKAAVRMADGTALFSGGPVHMSDLRRVEASAGGWGELVGARAAGVAA